MNYKDEKIFANCPWASQECRNCPNRGECIMKKSRRNAKLAKQRKAIVKRRMAISLLGMTMLVSSLYIVSFDKGDDVSRAERNESTITETQETETMETKTNELIVPYSKQVKELELSSGVSTQFIQLASSKVEEQNSDASVSTSETTITQTSSKAEEPETEPETESEIETNEDDVKDYTPQAEGPRDYYVYNLSAQDKKYIERLVYQEARGEKLEGVVAVAACVLNRYTSKQSQFDTSSIYAVITQSNQFADIGPVTQEMLDGYPNCAEAVELACRGWDPTRAYFSEGAKFFYAPNETLSDYQRSIRQGVPTYSIGNHNFHNEFSGN